MANLITLTKSNFKKTIEENEFVIVDFGLHGVSRALHLPLSLKLQQKKTKI